MTDSSPEAMHVTIHLLQQSTIEFNASELWPLHGSYARFGTDLASFAEEVTRRLSADGYLGYSTDPGNITVVPLGAVKRIDFNVRP